MQMKRTVLFSHKAYMCSAILGTATVLGASVVIANALRDMSSLLAVADEMQDEEIFDYSIVDAAAISAIGTVSGEEIGIPLKEIEIKEKLKKKDADEVGTSEKSEKDIERVDLDLGQDKGTREISLGDGLDALEADDCELFY